MGQFLSTGLICEMSVSRNKKEKGNISDSELISAMEKEMSLDMSLYVMKETDNDIIFTLNDEVMKNELIPFLEEFYPIVYKDEDEYKNLLQMLRENPSDEWLDIAYNEEESCFQLDEYGESEYIRFEDKDFRPSITINCDHIMLHISYGKISTEGIDDSLKLFKYCMVKAFKEHRIAKALRIYVTG